MCVLATLVAVIFAGSVFATPVHAAPRAGGHATPTAAAAAKAGHHGKKHKHHKHGGKKGKAAHHATKKA